MHRESQRKRLMSDYFDQGNLDLDAILDSFPEGGSEQSPEGIEAASSADRRIEEKRQRILALMELSAAPDIARNAIREGLFTEAQIEELFRIWTDEAQKSVAGSAMSLGRVSSNRIWRDFSAYHNGVRPRIMPVRFPVA